MLDLFRVNIANVNLSGLIDELMMVNVLARDYSTSRKVYRSK